MIKILIVFLIVFLINNISYGIPTFDGLVKGDEGQGVTEQINPGRK